MAGDNPIGPEIARAVRENEHENEEVRQEAQGRVGNNGMENRQEMLNAQGGYPPWGFNQGNQGNVQGFQNAPQQFPGGGSSYNPNARKHENFSYSNPKAVVQFPPGFDLGAKLPTHEGKPTNEDALNLILKKMESIEEQGKAMAKSYKGLEAQFAQMSQQQRTTDF
ncbi:hypothetical protein ACS0TY_003346 [Phlomoides rotata]